MNTRTLIAEIQKVAEEKNIRLKGLNIKNTNKNNLMSILNCFNLSNEKMSALFDKFKNEFPACANQLENNYLNYGWGRYHIYSLIK